MAHLEGSLTWTVQGTRTGCAAKDKCKAAKAAIARSKPRGGGGQFLVEKPEPAVGDKKKHRASEESMQAKLDKHIAEHKEEVTNLKAINSSTLQSLQVQIAEKDRLVRSLRAQLRIQATNQTQPSAAQGLVQPPSRKLLGGNTRVTKKKLSDTLQNFLERRYEQEAQAEALLSHYQRHPALYNLVKAKILEDNTNLTTFLAACQTHPEWLNPIRREVVQEIEKFWSTEKCLAIQLHCKVGHSEKYQHLINLASKTYSKPKKEWIRKELFHPGSEVFVPKFQSKNQVGGLRSEIAAEISLIQDEQGTACWIDLLPLIEETIRHERSSGYLQTVEQVDTLEVWLHWSGDAAGFLRGIKHTKFGFKLVGGGRVCSRSPRNLRTILLFEGKDNYES
jgi:hypothetical protein